MRGFEHADVPRRVPNLDRFDANTAITHRTAETRWHSQDDGATIAIPARKRREHEQRLVEMPRYRRLGRKGASLG